MHMPQRPVFIPAAIRANDALELPRADLPNCICRTYAPFRAVSIVMKSMTQTVQAIVSPKLGAIWCFFFAMMMKWEGCKQATMFLSKVRFSRS